MIRHKYRMLLLWCGWDAAGGVGRYQTDTWHASQAMSGHAHTNAPLGC